MLTAEQEATVAKAPPEKRAKLRELYEKKNATVGTDQADPDDPSVWEYNNPFTAIWNPNAKIGTGTKVAGVEGGFGYTSRPLSQAILQFNNLDREGELKRFQELAFQAGLYGANAEREDVAFGSYDDNTFKIWVNLNKSAAQAGLAGKKHTVWDRLQDLVDHRPESLGKDKKKKRAPLVTQLPDPRELEELIRGVAPKVIGRDPTDTEISEFSTMYRALAQNKQKEVYDLQDTEQGGTVDALPDADALAAFQLRTQNPDAYEEKRSAGRAQAYSQMLKGIL